MHSLASSSKWPSYDSLPSTCSFLLSESELTEDEADVFSSEGEGDSRVFSSEGDGDSSGDSSGGSDSKSFSPGSESEGVPRLRLAFIVGSGAECCPHTPSYPQDPRSGAATQGDLTFSQKCSELKRFISPLLALLEGLKTGRFEKGLSSFQQSVAMDRLQRIVGILQKPDMGERYLRTLLQVEVMLKVWFPQLTRDSLLPPGQTLAPRLPPRWHQAQLHIPVKKRKLSWLDSDFPSAVPLHCKRPRPCPGESYRRGPEESYRAGPEESYRPGPEPEPASPGESYRAGPEPEPASPGESYRGGPEPASYRGGPGVADSERCSSDTCCRGGEGERPLQPTPPSQCHRLAKQDTSVSSTLILEATDSLLPPLVATDSLLPPLVATDSLLHPLSGQQPLRCSSGGGPVMMSQEVCGRSRSLPATVRPVTQEVEGT